MNFILLFSFKDCPNNFPIQLCGQNDQFESQISNVFIETLTKIRNPVVLQLVGVKQKYPMSPQQSSNLSLGITSLANFQ